MVNEAQGKYLICNGTIEETEMSNRFENIDMPVYEVVEIKSGVVLFEEDHWERLSKSLENKKITPTRTIEEIREDINNLISRNDIDHGYIKLLLTEDQTLIYEHWDMKRQESIDVSILDLERSNPNLKILDNDYKKEINNLFMEKETQEVILRNEMGGLLEGGRSNLYFIKDGYVTTAPKSMILPGIRKKILSQVLKNLKIELIEEIVYDYQLLDLEGAFVTGTTMGVSPIEYVDSISINSMDSQVMKDIIAEYQKIEDNYIKSKK